MLLPLQPLGKMPMRSTPTSLGERLQSVALRYQPTARGLAVPTMAKERNATSSSAIPQVADHEPESINTKLGQLEAVLFLARQPTTSRKLAKLANLADGTETRTLVRQLQRRYNQRGCAMQIVEVAGGFQMLTRPHLARWLGRLHGGPEELRLSAPAMETLSVVAYRQPVPRAEVEAIRGVQCGEILRVLMERELLRIVGRSEELGRPFLYGTTKTFLQIFGLHRLEHLPPIDQTRSVVATVVGGSNPTSD